MIYPFLERYQSDTPMVPFMYDDITTVMKSVLSLFCKDEYANSLTLESMSQLDFNKINNSDHKRNIVLGSAASNLISNMRRLDQVSEIMLFKFTEDCKTLITCLLKKLQERMLIGINFFKSSSSLSPQKITSEKASCLTARFTRLAHNLSNKSIISDQEADKSCSEYTQLLMLPSTKIYCKQYDASKSLDDFFYNTLNIENDYPNLFKVVTVVLVLFHGQADVERGFSESKGAERVNMSEMTLVAKRTVKNHLKTNQVTPATVVINKEMLQSVKAARKRCELYREKSKSEEAAAKKMSVKRTLQAELDISLKKIEELRRLQASLRDEYESYYDKAGDEKDLAKSHSLVLNF